MRIWPRTKSIRTHFVGVLLVTATAVGGVLGGFAYDLAYRQTVATARESIEDLITALQNTAAIAAYARDQVLMQEVLQGLTRTRLVARVQLLADGQVVMEAGGQADAPAGAQADGGGELARDLRSPFDPKETIARIRIQPASGFIAAEARRAAWTVVGLSLVQVALAAIAMYLTAARFVSRPIVSLARSLGSMTPGTSQRLQTEEVHHQDEIGLLVAGANALLQSNEDALQRERTLRAEVERMEAQYRQIFDSSSAGIFLVDESGRLMNGNPTVMRLLGRPLEDLQLLKGANFLQAAFAEPQQAHEMVRQAMQRHEAISDDLRVGGPPSERPRWVHCMVSLHDSPPDTEGRSAPLFEGVMYDITERKAAEREIRRRAELDGLTGLRNRASTDAAIHRLLKEAQAGEQPAALMLIDLDGFKAVNDQLGHQAGDHVLQECARRMSARMGRSSDVLGRLGGDEFAVALLGVGPDHAHVAELAAELVEALCEPFTLPDGRQARIGASIGIACSPRHGTSLPELSGRADGALYMVKRHDKRGWAFGLS